MMRSRTRFGVVLERICSAQGLTQKEAADGIGVAPETITRWKGSFSPPTAELFRALDFFRRFEPALAADDLVGPAAPADSTSEAAC